MKHGATHLNLVELSRVLDERYGVVKHHTNDLIRYHVNGLSFYFRLGDIDNGWLAKIKFPPSGEYVKVVNLQPSATVEYPPHSRNEKKMQIYSYSKNENGVTKINWFEKSLDTRHDEDVWLCFPPQTVYINGGSPYYLTGDTYSLEAYEKEKCNPLVSPKLINRWFEINVEKIYVLIEEYESYFDSLDSEREKKNTMYSRVAENTGSKTTRRGKAFLKITKMKNGDYWEVGNGEQRIAYDELVDEYGDLFYNDKQNYDYNFRYFKHKILPKLREKGYYRKDF